ncbi:MAG: SpoIIE family protein phosphatase [Desulfobacteraceae bacterium]|nr:SpoIIE family protein phosphatase [Desulfobacteraceae bacterium]
MVLFTDGITESVDDEGKLFGNKRLINIIEKNGDKSASDVHECIIDCLKPYHKMDDVTLLIVKEKNDNVSS